MRQAVGITGPVVVDLDAEVLEKPIPDVEIPTDFLRTVQSEPAAMKTFERLAPSHQKEFVF